MAFTHRTLDNTRWLLAIAIASSAGLNARAADDSAVDYNRDIRPILADTCYKCHGPDGNQRQADLRMDVESVVGLKLDGGHTAIVAGSAATSAVVARITSRDPETRMPPRESGKSLTPVQIELITKWVDQGAKWQGHWAFQPPTRPTPPTADLPGWRSNPIDAFVLSRLRSEGLTPSPRASREALIRRVTLDLTGLPPTIDEIDRFLADTRPGSYRRVVDRLLGSTRYGEHVGRRSAAQAEPLATGRHRIQSLQRDHQRRGCDR